MKYKVANINDYSIDDINLFYKKIHIQKKNKIDKYKNNINKKQSIIGDFLLNDLLKENNILYDNLVITFNEHGKPHINNYDIYYNISHSFDYVITIISNKIIGIDIEKIRKTPLNTINQFATEKEKKYILSNNNNVERRIFEIYTLKEAYFKMKGSNLNNILDVEFQIDNGIIHCNDNKVKTGFINDIEGYIIAYCEKI